MRKTLFSSLVESIVVQRLTLAAGDANLQRLSRLFPKGATPERVLAVKPAHLKKVGISAAKVTAIRNLARAFQTGEVSPDAIVAMQRRKAIDALSELEGVGAWTAKRALTETAKSPS